MSETEKKKTLISTATQFFLHGIVDVYTQVAPLEVLSSLAAWRLDFGIEVKLIKLIVLICNQLATAPTSN